MFGFSEFLDDWKIPLCEKQESNWENERRNKRHTYC